jgi:hypothetical protein
MKLHTKHPKCNIKRVYVPSKYELRHWEIAKEIAKNSTEVYTRRRMLVQFMSSKAEIEKAKYWTSRVVDHMKSEENSAEKPHDKNFFSRFIVTKTCDDPGSESSRGGAQIGIPVSHTL